MKIGVFGTGAYGLALTSILSENNNEVIMWTKFEEEKNLLMTTRGNDKLLPGYRLDDNVKITTNIYECAKDKDLLIIVIPAQFVSDLCTKLSPYVDDSTKICIASKGIEKSSGYFISDIVKEILNTEKIAVISGPTFAKDIIAKKPIGLSLATMDMGMQATVDTVFSNDHVKLRATEDIIGVEICGAIKNVMAIAAGILNGLNATESTKAMFLTESLHDIEEIIDIFNGDKKTILSYAGFGDIILTCTSTSSRNYSFGRLVGLNDEVEIRNYLSNTTVEGYDTLVAIYKLLGHKRVDVPIIDLMYKIINNEIEPQELLKFLVEKK